MTLQPLLQSVWSKLRGEFIIALLWVALAVAIVTSALYVIGTHITFEGAIFVYLLPTSFIAVRFGSTVGMVMTIASDLAAAYFLYSPTLSFQIDNPLNVLQIVFFSMLAMMATKVVHRFDRSPAVQGHKQS